MSTTSLVDPGDPKRVVWIVFGMVCTFVIALMYLYYKSQTYVY